MGSVTFLFFSFAFQPQIFGLLSLRHHPLPWHCLLCPKYSASRLRLTRRSDLVCLPLALPLSGGQHHHISKKSTPRGFGWMRSRVPPPLRNLPAQLVICPLEERSSLMWWDCRARCTCRGRANPKMDQTAAVLEVSIVGINDAFFCLLCNHETRIWTKYIIALRP